MSTPARQKWSKKKSERVAAYKHAWYEAHKDLASLRRRYRDKQDAIRAAQMKYDLDHPEEAATRELVKAAANAERAARRKEKNRLAKREYYYANREEILAKNRANYAANPEKVLAKNKASRMRNPETVIAYRKRYRAANRDRLNAIDRRYYYDNRDERLAYANRRFAENREEITARNRIAHGLPKPTRPEPERCEACGQKETRKLKGKVMNLSLDHDHDNGRFRGWLCYSCNIILGLVDDDPGLQRTDLRRRDPPRRTRGAQLRTVCPERKAASQSSAGCRCLISTLKISCPSRTT